MMNEKIKKNQTEQEKWEAEKSTEPGLRAQLDNAKNAHINKAASLKNQPASPAVSGAQKDLEKTIDRMSDRAFLNHVDQFTADLEKKMKQAEMAGDHKAAADFAKQGREFLIANQQKIADANANVLENGFPVKNLSVAESKAATAAARERMAAEDSGTKDPSAPDDATPDAAGSEDEIEDVDAAEESEGVEDPGDSESEIEDAEVIEDDIEEVEDVEDGIEDAEKVEDEIEEADLSDLEAALNVIEEKGSIEKAQEKFKDYLADLRTRKPNAAKTLEGAGSFLKGLVRGPKSYQKWKKRNPKAAMVVTVGKFAAIGAGLGYFAGVGVGAGIVAKGSRVVRGMVGGAVGSAGGQGLHRLVASKKYKERIGTVDQLFEAKKDEMTAEQLAEYADRVDQARERNDDTKYTRRRRWAGIGGLLGGVTGAFSPEILDSLDAEPEVPAETTEELTPMNQQITEDSIESDSTTVEALAEIIEEDPEPAIEEENVTADNSVQEESTNNTSQQQESNDNNSQESTGSGEPAQEEVVVNNDQEESAAEDLEAPTAGSVMSERDLNRVPGGTAAAGDIEHMDGPMGELFPGGVHVEAAEEFERRNLSLSPETLEAAGIEPVEGLAENGEVLRDKYTGDTYTWYDFLKKVDYDAIHGNIEARDFVPTEVYPDEATFEPSDIEVGNEGSTTEVYPSEQTFDPNDVEDNSGQTSTETVDEMVPDETTFDPAKDSENGQTTTEVYPSEQTFDPNNIEGDNGQTTPDEKVFGPNNPGETVELDDSSNTPKDDLREMYKNLDMDSVSLATEGVDGGVVESEGSNTSMMEAGDIETKSETGDQTRDALENTDSTNESTADTGGEPGVETLDNNITSGLGQNDIENEATITNGGMSLEDANQAGIHADDMNAVTSTAESLDTVTDIENVPAIENIDQTPSVDDGVESTSESTTVDTTIENTVNPDNTNYVELEQTDLETEMGPLEQAPYQTEGYPGYESAEPFSPEARNLLIEGDQNQYKFPPLPGEAPQIFADISITELEDGSFAFGKSVETANMSAFQAEELALEQSTEFLETMGINGSPELVLDNDLGTEKTYYTSISRGQAEFIINEYLKNAVQ